MRQPCCAWMLLLAAAGVSCARSNSPDGDSTHGSGTSAAQSSSTTGAGASSSTTGASASSSTTSGTGMGGTMGTGGGSMATGGAGGMGGSGGTTGTGGAMGTGGGTDAGPPDAGDDSGNMDGGGPLLLTFMVVRVGDGSAILTDAAAPVFLEKRALDGTLVPGNNPLPLPIVMSGGNRPLTLSGTASTEGNLSRSDNKAYVTLGGYGAPPGTLAVDQTMVSAVRRIVGRIDAAGNIDTSTRINSAFDMNSIRSATSSDGTVFWVSGNGTGGTGGVHTVPFGTMGNTQILATPDNSRFVHVIAGQLYGSSATTSYATVFKIGTGLPTTPGQVATLLPGLPTTTPNPFSFAFFDRNSNVPGLDTLYIADGRNPGAGGGVEKWSFNGTTWTLVTVFNQGLATGLRGLAGAVTGNDVTLIVTTAEATQNKVVIYVDDGSMSPAGTVIATAPVDTVFRGVALSPE